MRLRPQRETQRRDPESVFLKLLKDYKKDFETNTLPEIRKRMHFLTPLQSRRAKDKRAMIRKKELG